MNDPIYHKQKFDTSKSWQAFQDYLRLPKLIRTVPALLNCYQDRVREQSSLSKAVLAPSLSLATLSRWSAECRWIERAKTFDDHQAAMLNAARAQVQQDRIEGQAKAEQDEIERFRTTSLMTGRSMIRFAQTMLDLIKTVPMGLDGASLTDKDIERL